jgi:hypothetical protein
MTERLNKVDTDADTTPKHSFTGSEGHRHLAPEPRRSQRHRHGSPLQGITNTSVLPATGHPWARFVSPKVSQNTLPPRNRSPPSTVRLPPSSHKTHSSQLQTPLKYRFVFQNKTHLRSPAPHNSSTCQNSPLHGSFSRSSQDTLSSSSATCHPLSTVRLQVIIKDTRCSPR